MIRADQIPPEVVEALARTSWELKHPKLWEILKATQPEWEKEARAAIAAALNAWPGMHHYAPSAEPYYGKHIILPLPQEPRDDA